MDLDANFVLVYIWVTVTEPNNTSCTILGLSANMFSNVTHSIICQQFNSSVYTGQICCCLHRVAKYRLRNSWIFGVGTWGRQGHKLLQWDITQSSHFVCSVEISYDYGRSPRPAWRLVALRDHNIQKLVGEHLTFPGSTITDLKVML